MALHRVDGLSPAPLAAATQFHSQELPRIIAALSQIREPLTLVFAPADHTHRAWRLAAVQALARARAPRRVNAVASDDEAAIAAAERYLAEADGVTGHYLALDSHGASDVIASAG